MSTASFTSKQRLRGLQEDLAGTLMEGFLHDLYQTGFSEGTVRRHIRAARHLMYWSDLEGLTAGELNADILQRFEAHLIRCRCLGYRNTNRLVLCGVRLFLTYLRRTSAIAVSSAEPGAHTRTMLDSFNDWMRAQRGITDTTLNNYGATIRALLTTLGDKPRKYNAQNIRAFLLSQTRDRGWAAAKKCTTALRMFLRFLIAEGKCNSRLVAAIPVVAHWRLSSLPRYLESEEVERVIASCDRDSPPGKRDRAILLLLARLGLRAGDIVRLQLGDIDWKRAWISVCGKGRRLTQLPLTNEVGRAIVDYLQQERPPAETDTLFIRSRPPFTAFTSHCAVSVIVKRAMRRAGVACPSRGAAHVLRHSMATSMLRQGATLQDIAAVLRHRSIETTQIYAKVNIAVLQQIAQPWPEVQPCYLKLWSRI